MTFLALVSGLLIALFITTVIEAIDGRTPGDIAIASFTGSLVAASLLLLYIVAVAP